MHIPFLKSQLHTYFFSCSLPFLPSTKLSKFSLSLPPFPTTCTSSLCSDPFCGSQVLHTCKQILFHRHLGSCFPSGWSHLWIRLFLFFFHILLWVWALDVESIIASPTIHPSAAQCREIINKSVIHPNTNICVHHWNRESKTADGSIYQFYCRHRWYPDKGKLCLVLAPQWSQWYLKYCEMLRFFCLFFFVILFEVSEAVLLMSQATLRELKNKTRYSLCKT